MRSRSAAAWVLLLLAPVVAAGCMKPQDPGPLTMRVDSFVIHSPDDVTAVLVLQNTGSLPLRDLYLDVDLFRTSPDGGITSSHADSIYLWNTTARRMTHVPSYFDETEVLQPGQSRTFELPMRFGPDDAPTPPGGYLHLHAAIEYTDSKNVYWYSEGFGCWTETGTHVTSLRNCVWKNVGFTVPYRNKTAT